MYCEQPSFHIGMESLPLTSKNTTILTIAFLTPFLLNAFAFKILSYAQIWPIRKLRVKISVAIFILEVGGGIKTYILKYLKTFLRC